MFQSNSQAARLYEVLKSVFDESAEIRADWDDANAVCDRHGAPKGMSLTGKITWLLTGRKVLTKGAN